MKTCASCKYWQRDGADGICRFSILSAKMFQVQKGKYTLVWPRMRADEWCGEWKSREVEDA